MNEECGSCGDKKYMFMSPDGSPLGGPTNMVAPCLKCSSNLNLKDIQKDGGFVLTKEITWN